jgi:hypothetical protein
MTFQMNTPSPLIRSGQQGAALLTTLLMSTLLLGAGMTLLVVTTSSRKIATDSTAEMQAYYSAETGLASALNVLRGNIAPNGAMPAGTRINFRNAVTLSASNLSADSATTPRLSAWLNYDYTPAGAPNPDRVSLSSSYDPRTGIAYSLAVSDPDNTPVGSGEPTRLLLRVTGYGPKGAIKQMELVVNRTNFDYVPPATILMRSADDGTPVVFTTGNSAAKTYSGQDHSGPGILPAFGSTTNPDTAIELAAANKNTVAAPIAATIAMSSLPVWLQSADQARAFLATQKDNATNEGRYFTTFSGDAGSSSAPAFTFVDGDCNLSGGAGLLIVTGTLTMSGNPGFNGLILVMGNGSVLRNGGGNGAIYGAITVARFDPVNSGPFLAPTFDTNGGGNSTLQYDSDAVRQALNVSGPRVLGVHEY